MGLHYHDSDARWYSSMWLLAVLFIIAALVIVWLAFFRVTNPTPQQQQEAQVPSQTIVVPGPPGPQGPPGPPGPAAPAAQPAPTPGSTEGAQDSGSGQGSVSSQDNSGQ